MKRGGLGILVFLIVALLVAFLLMKQLQHPTSLNDKAAEMATEAAEAAVDAINEVVENSGLTEKLEGILSQIGGVG